LQINIGELPSPPSTPGSDNLIEPTSILTPPMDFQEDEALVFDILSIDNGLEWQI
jgi:hypothetical protein